MSAPQTFTLTWEGRRLTIEHHEAWIAGADHLAIRSEDREPLPITETGYRSHFFSGEKLAARGGPVAYVTAWLDDAARTSEWKAYVAASRQLSLF
jgi:hypothetical protein